MSQNFCSTSHQFLFARSQLETGKSWQTGTEFVHQPFFIIPLPSSCHQLFTTNMRWIGWKMLSSFWLSWKLFSCGELTCERQWEGRGRGGWGGSCEGKYLMGDAIELSGLHSLTLLILHSVSSGKYMRVESSQNSKVSLLLPLFANLH